MAVKKQSIIKTFFIVKSLFPSEAGEKRISTDKKHFRG